LAAGLTLLLGGVLILTDRYCQRKLSS
jgi:hypothetical protein